MIQMIKDKLQESSIEQYKYEERAALAKRILSAETRIQKIIRIMSHDIIAPDEHINQLKMELYRYTNDINFKTATSMGFVLKAAFEYVAKNYKHPDSFKPGK